MSFVVDAIEDVGDAVGDALDWVIDEVIDPVMTTVSNVIESALDNPVKTIAQIAAIATQQYWALPLIEGADVAAKGGDLGDVLEATAKAYVMQEVGSYVGKAAGSYAGTAATEAGASAASAKIAENVVGAAAGSAAVAVVSGQDPVKAFITGGVGAAMPAVLGQVSGFKELPGSAQRVISSAVSAQLSGGNVTAAVIGSTIAASGIVTDALKSFDPDGTKLDNTQRAILTDVLMGTATAAITGGSPSNVIKSAMMKAGSKALGDMATNAFKTATAEATTSYNAASKVADKLDANQAAQATAAKNYNDTAAALQKKIDEQNRLQTAYNNAVAAHNANPSEATANAANAAIATYNSYVTNLNKEYNDTFKPALDKYGGELDSLKQAGAVLTGDYEKAIKAFSTKTDTISDVLDPIYRTSNRAFVEAMDDKFDAEQYRKLNGLGADVDPYEHFLSKGQFEGAPTNNKSAEPIIAAERTRLVTQALESKGVTLATADPAVVSKILDNIDAKYGNNVGAMKAASIQDVISGNTSSINTLVADQQNGVFRVEVRGGSYGEWNKPPTDRFTAPAGTKLASFEAFNNGTASLVYDTKGNPVWIENDPRTAVKSWNPAQGDTTPTVTIVGKRPTEQEKILAMSELTGADAVNGVVSQGMINAAKTLVGWAKDTGNSTVINTAANVIKAGGGFIESINGISALFGAVPKDTAMGKFANALNNIGKAGNTAQYQAAIKDVKDMIGNAKGVGGTLAAIYKGATTYPLEFAAEFIGVEGFQEIAPFLIGGAATTAAKGLALARGVGQQLATRIGNVAGMTSAISTDVIESAGGAAAGAFDEAYKLAIKNGKSEADATKIALDIAQKSGIVSGLVTAASMGLGGGALEKAIFNGKVSGTGFGDALNKLGQAAKTGTQITIKEGVSEAGEEGITQAFLEGQLYKLDPNRDVAANITAAAAFGAIAGGPIAGTAYAGSQAGDVLSNAMMGNPQIASVLETNKGNPAAADAALANLGITDNTIKSNLMNVVDDTNYTSSQEAADTLAKRSDYSFTGDDVTALTGKGTDLTLASRVEAYVDPRVFDLAEVKAAAAAEGYTLTDAEAAKLVGQKDEAAATSAARAEFDPKATNYDEAKSFFTDKGYTPSADEIKQFVGSKAESTQTKAVADYVNPRQVTTEEAKKYLTDLGYKPTDAEVKRFVGQVNEAEQAKAIGTYVDPRMVDEGEVKAAYESLGLKKPTADDLKKLMGQYDETGLTAKATEYLPTARFNSIMAQLDEMSSGGVSQEARDAIDLVRKDLTKSIADTGLEVAKVALKVDNAKADLEKAITTATKGLATPADVDAAIAKIQFPAGLSKEDVSSAIKTYMEANPGLSLEDVATKISEATKGLATSEGVKTEIAAAIKGLATTKDIETAISNIKFPAGITKEDVAAEIKTYMEANPGLSLADVASKIGDATKGLATSEGVKTEIAAAVKGLATTQDIKDAIAGIEFPAGLSKDDVSSAIKIYMEANPGLSIDEVATKIGDATKGLATPEQVKTAIETALTGVATTAEVKTAISDALKTTEGRFDTIDKAIQDLRDAGLTAEDVRATVDKIVGSAGTDKTAATGIYAHIDGVNTKIDNINTLIGAPAEGDTAATGLYAKIAENEAAGMKREEATQKAIADVAADLGTTKADLLKSLGTTEGNLTRKIEGLETALTTTEKNILDRVKEYEKAGLTRDEATQKAIETVAADLGTTKADLLTALGTTEANLTKSMTDLSTQVSDLSTKLGDVETNILSKMADYEKAGIGRDEALSKAIDDVAADLGTTKADLLSQIGTTEATLKEEVGLVETNLGAKIADAKDEVLKELGLAKTGLSEEISASEGRTATKIGDVETNILAKMANYEKAGIGRDEALSRAIDDVSAELGTTRTDILTQIGKTEANLKADLASTKTELKTDIGTAKQEVLDRAAEYEKAGIARDQALQLAQADMAKTLGQGTQQATQSDLDAVINLLQTQGAYDAQYDYNGDRVIDQNDKVAIENYLNRSPDTTAPFTPAAGSKWAPTGVFKTVADEAEATRQAQAAEAEKTRQAATRNAANQARLGNINSLTSMLAQAGDTGGQQVTVKAADPAKIGYIYDWNSIFANPSQEKMFASPFAQGGMVDGSDDVNEELLKILKG
jgi:hypothetical protein